MYLSKFSTMHTVPVQIFDDRLFEDNNFKDSTIQWIKIRCE